MLHIEIRIRLQGANPIDQFPGRWLFLNPSEIPHLIKSPDRTIKEVFAYIREMNLKNFSHHISFGEGNVMEVAFPNLLTSEEMEWVREQS